MIINRSKEYTLSPEEITLVLDSLAVQPYNKVFRLIGRLASEADDTPKVPEGDVNTG